MTQKTEDAKTAEIYQFPKTSKDGFSTYDPKQVVSNVMDMKIGATEDSLEFIAPMVFDLMGQAGYRCDDEYMNAMLVAVLRAMMHDHFNVPNPLSDYLYKYRKKMHSILEDQLTGFDMGSGEAD